MQSASLLPALIVLIMLAAGHWGMFTKAGEPGWKALIPIYSDITLFKLVWDVRAFVIYVASGIGFIVLYLLSGQIHLDASGQLFLTEASNGLLAGLAYVLSLVFLAYCVILAIRTAFAYGKSALFAFGLLILPNIFALILGFGSAQYRGIRQ